MEKGERYMRLIDGRKTYWEFSHCDGYYAVSTMLTSMSDDTANEQYRYDGERCSKCWLGHAHSGDMHRQKVAAT